MRQNTTNNVKSQRGFMLMESLLALMIFALFVTSLTKAIQSSSQLQQSIAVNKWVNKQLQNVIVEVVDIPHNKSEFLKPKEFLLDEYQGKVNVEIEKAQVYSDEETELNDLYDIHLKISWYWEGKQVEQQYKITHYYPLSQ